MGVETFAATMIVGAIDSYNDGQRRARQQANFDKYMADYAARTKRDVKDLNFRLNKNISEGVGTQVAQSNASVAARSGQSGLGGASTEALMTQANAPIYSAAAKSRSEGEATIADYERAREDAMASMKYNQMQQQNAIDNSEPGALGKVLGLVTTAANIYKGVETLKGTKPSTDTTTTKTEVAKTAEVQNIAPDMKDKPAIQMELASTKASFTNLDKVFANHSDMALKIQDLRKFLMPDGQLPQDQQQEDQYDFAGNKKLLLNAN